MPASRPRGEAPGKPQGTGPERLRPWAVALLAGLALTACQVPDEINPVVIYREISGEADAGRLPPPGMDQPRPNLASVPPRPERPSAASRAAIFADLAKDRANSREPLAFRTTPAPTAASLAPAAPGLPAAPPPRPALAAAPRIPWSEAPVPSRPAPNRPVPAGATLQPDPQATVMPEPQAPAVPEMAPAPPPLDLLGLPPPPSPDLLVPPRPR
jgi:hypothetical protein